MTSTIPWHKIFPTLTSSKYGTNSRGLMKSAMLRVLTQALADDWPPTATVSEPIMCEGGTLTSPRLMALVSTSLSFGKTWSVRMWGRTSDRMSRSSTSLRSRFFTPLRLMLWAVWLSRFGSIDHTTIISISIIHNIYQNAVLCPQYLLTKAVYIMLFVVQRHQSA